MQVNRILITSDDGYDSIGVKLLVRALGDRYELKVAGTKEQMSGVGGMVHLRGGSWGMDEVLGREALWVDGSPVDAVECAVAKWGESFDVVLSGINWGPNVGGTLINSGTFAAAFAAVNLRAASRSMALSLELDPKYFLYKHEGNEELEKKFSKYPGEKAIEIVEMAIEHDWWGAQMLNVNFPLKPTGKVQFTQPIEFVGDYYQRPLELDEKRGSYTYPSAYTGRKIDESFDVGAMQAGMISITPCQATMLDAEVWKKLADKSQ